MLGQPTAPQMVILDPTEPLWCEQTQDMSGYVLQDTTLPPSDEQFNFNISTAQIENDFYVQNSPILSPSPEEFIIGDQFEAAYGEDNMFDNSNYSVLNSKINDWLTSSISTMDVDELTTKTNMIEKEGDYYLPRIGSENSFILPDIQKADIKPPAPAVKKSGYLSIFDSEEPHIKEETEISYCCTDDKLTFEVRDDIDVAEVVVETTEEQDELRPPSQPDSFTFDFTSLEFPVHPKMEDVTSPEQVEEMLSSPLSRVSAMEMLHDLDMDFVDEEKFVFNFGPTASPKTFPRLHLDIEAAVSSSHVIFEGFPDTPELLKPLLKPEADFDILKYHSADDSNIIAITPTPLRQQERGQGKSHLSISELQECIKYGRGKPSPCILGEQLKPIPAPSTSSGRPARKSATKFKRMLQEGLLESTFDYQSASSDDEDSAPKRKRRRTVSSSSSRKRLNSDSDLSSICDDNLKYRERRDRNNLSSRRSRQKRKVQQELKKLELKQLEAENLRLKKVARRLEKMVRAMHALWAQYVAKIKKETDKDEGEHC